MCLSVRFTALLSVSQRRCKGSDLLNEVFDYLDLSVERKYFGLLVEDLTQDFAYRWLDATKVLKKQLTTMSPHHLYFKVRFFLTDPSTQIDDEFTKYLYVLQIKKELLSGKMWCPRSTAAVLASYLVQSKRSGKRAADVDTFALL